MTPVLNNFDFTANVQPVELEPIYWLDGQCLSRAFCQALPRELGGPTGHSDGCVCRRPTFAS